MRPQGEATKSTKCKALAGSKTKPVVPFAEAAKASDEALLCRLDSLPAAQRDRVEAVRKRSRGPGNDMRLKQDAGALAVQFTHSDPETGALLLMADLGTMDPAFFSGITGQIARIGAAGVGVDEGNSNFLLSVVRAIQPRDEAETMLAVQMGAIHAATMMLARRLNLVETLPQQDAAERALNKLARTYAVQMETLKRYRTGGQQRVTVEHVTVNAGGQAIVGAVETRGRGGAMKQGGNPLHPAQRLAMAPRCTARAKRSGLPCQSPAVSGWKVCRMHGARGGAPSGARNGNWAHGARSQEVQAMRRSVSALIRLVGRPMP